MAEQLAPNLSTLVLLPNFDVWARPIIVNPVASQPGAPPYSARFDDVGLPLRGIFYTTPLDVQGENGMILSDQKTELDVREVEFGVVPVQFDRIIIPVDGTIPDEGEWEVRSSSRDGEGCTTLSIQRWVGTVTKFDPRLLEHRFMAAPLRRLRLVYKKIVW